MKYIRMLLVVIGLFVAGGSIATVLADDDNHHKVTLYTPPLLRGANIECNAINVSDKTLDITITIIGSDGVPLSTTDPTNFMTLPGTMVSSAYHEAIQLMPSTGIASSRCLARVIVTTSG